VAAVLAVAVSLALPAAAGGVAAPEVSPSVRQLAWWAGGMDGMDGMDGMNGVGDLDVLTARLRASGASVVRRLPLASSVVVDVPGSWRPPTGVRTTVDRSMSVLGTKDHSPRAKSPSAGPPAAAVPATGSDGSGVTVALVDTGVSPVGDLPASVQHVNVSGAPAGDGFGHGTFLAGVIAGSGAASGGVYPGVAPGARILDVQVAAADGSTSLLRVLAGLQVVADRARHDASIRVVNLSLSAGDPGAPGLDPLSRAVESLWDRGLVVVVSAGNDGPAAGTVTVPGTDAAVITVGALDDLGTTTRTDDVVAPFSARGAAGDPGAKPDLVAPGVKVVGLRAPGSVIDTQYPTGRVGSANFRGSGTSMATAVVSGAVAGLLATRPDLDPDEVKLALTEGAYALPGAREATGAGGLDAAGARLAADRLAQERTGWAGGAVAAQYQRFAEAWQTGSRDEATAAWTELPPALRAQVAQAWATAVAADGRAEATQAAVARTWAADGDLGAGWLSRSWASRSWAAEDWASRSWASRSWASRSWASRSWVGEDWASRSWASRSWAADDWASRSWASRSWAAGEWGSGSP